MEENDNKLTSISHEPYSYFRALLKDFREDTYWSCSWVLPLELN